MRKVKVAIVAVAIVLDAALFGGSISAADIGPLRDRSGPIVAPTPIWSGVYLGASVGYTAGNNDAQEINGPRRYITDFSGATGALHLGWQQQLGQFVTGIEGELGYLGMGSTVSRDVTGGTISSGAELGLYSAVSARFGVLPSPNWLIYGRVGMVVAAIDGKTTQTCTDATLCSGAQSAAISQAAVNSPTWGVLLGAGLERKLNSNWIARAEYRFMSFRKELALPAVDGPGWNHRVDAHLLSVGVGYKF